MHYSSTVLSLPNVVWQGTALKGTKPPRGRGRTGAFWKQLRVTRRLHSEGSLIHHYVLYRGGAPVAKSPATDGEGGTVLKAFIRMIENEYGNARAQAQAQAVNQGC